jgi:hypothetical protein
MTCLPGNTSVDRNGIYQQLHSFTQHHESCCTGCHDLHLCCERTIWAPSSRPLLCTPNLGRLHSQIHMARRWSCSLHHDLLWSCRYTRCYFRGHSSKQHGFYGPGCLWYLHGQRHRPHIHRPYPHILEITQNASRPDIDPNLGFTHVRWDWMLDCSYLETLAT